MSSHTPGPWFQVGAWVEVEEDDVADICTCHTEDFGQGHLGRSADEMMANACLIASAPDMLDCLMEAEELLVMFAESPSLSTPRGASEIVEFLTNIRAVIAKAQAYL